MIDIQQLTSLISAFRGETFLLTLLIAPASRKQAGVMTDEDYILLLLEPLGQIGSGIEEVRKKRRCWLRRKQ